MKTKQIFIAGILAVTVCAAGFLGTTNSNEKEKMLDSNVEALTDPESGASCGGYRDWGVDGDSNKREFYDCTCTLRSGYNPSGNCN